MAFAATVELQDSYGRKSSKRVETTAATLADAITAIGLYLTDLAAITDLACLKVSYHSEDTSGAFSGQAGSNVDVGGTFRVLLDNGKYAAHKVPAIKATLVDSGGNIDVADALIVAYFANFLTGGDCRLSEGNFVVSVVSGILDR